MAKARRQGHAGRGVGEGGGRESRHEGRGMEQEVHMRNGDKAGGVSVVSMVEAVGAAYKCVAGAEGGEAQGPKGRHLHGLTNHRLHPEGRKHCAWGSGREGREGWA
jgi:hypothetical protein